MLNQFVPIRVPLAVENTFPKGLPIYPLCTCRHSTPASIYAFERRKLHMWRRAYRRLDFSCEMALKAILLPSSTGKQAQAGRMGQVVSSD